MFNTLSSILSLDIQIPYEIILNTNSPIANLEQNLLKNRWLKFSHLKISKNYFLDNWGESYKYLFNLAKGEYIYFLEDDDLLLTDFSFLDDSNLATKKEQKLNLSHLKNSSPDYYFGKYKYHVLRENINWKQEFFKLFKLNHKKLFFEYPNPDNFQSFQLSQLVIKKKIIKFFPITNNKYNDYYLFKNNPGKIKYLNKYFFQQGIAKNNVS